MDQSHYRKATIALLHYRYKVAAIYGVYGLLSKLFEDLTIAASFYAQRLFGVFFHFAITFKLHFENCSGIRVACYLHSYSKKVSLDISDLLCELLLILNLSTWWSRLI